MEYNIIAAGGTFDYLHEGHKAFLLWLFSHAEKVLLGITSDEFANSTKDIIGEDFPTRKGNIQLFLKENGLLERVTLISIDDVYGPLLTDKFPVDALGVTEDTYKGAEVINIRRKELGLSIFPILCMQLVITSNEHPISSTAIRMGEMSKKGEVWVKNEWTQYSYALPSHVREELQKPFGQIFTSIPEGIISQKTITVGDVTTKLFNMHGLSQQISIVDFVVERTQLFHSVEELGFEKNYPTVLLENPAGHIAKNAWMVVRDALENDSPILIHVQGEEDLLVLVCILVAPLGYHIFYGQPHKGLVDVEVTLEAKTHARELMDMFVRVEL